MKRRFRDSAPRAGACRWTIWILAGGASSRMGRDKSRLQIGGRTLVQLIRDTARRTGHPVRVIRKDVVPKCGPLGGFVTGLRRSRADWHLFLSCDMPLISGRLLERVIRRAGSQERPVFVKTGDGFGFPLALRRGDLESVELAMSSRRHSIQHLARSLGAVALRPPRHLTGTLLNVNTPEDFDAVRASMTRRRP